VEQEQALIEQWEMEEFAKNHSPTAPSTVAPSRDTELANFRTSASSSSLLDRAFRPIRQYMRERKEPERLEKKSSGLINRALASTDSLAKATQNTRDELEFLVRLTREYMADREALMELQR
jgi:hypothetical protein